MIRPNPSRLSIANVSVITRFPSAKIHTVTFEAGFITILPCLRVPALPWEPCEDVVGLASTLSANKNETPLLSD